MTVVVKCYFKHTKDYELLKAMDAKAFPTDYRRDFSDDKCWLITDVGHKTVGFCCMRHHVPDEVFLSRSAIFDRGHGFHRASIIHRLNWAKRSGVKWALTYTSMDNYPSMVNLIKCNFELYEPDYAYAGRKNVFYFRKEL